MQTFDLRAISAPNAKGVLGDRLVVTDGRTLSRLARPAPERDHSLRYLVGSLPFSIVRPMATTLEELAESAMSLPPESRARLADLLVESLESVDLGAIDRLWIADAKRRRDEVRAGRVQTVPGEEALKKVRDAVRR